jgi:hypothetical protein
VARLLDVAPALARLGDVFGAVRMDDLGPEAGAV